MSRQAIYEHMCTLAGVTPDGGILPPIGVPGIDRSPVSWWTNRMTKEQMKDAIDKAHADRQVGKLPVLAAGYGSDIPAEDYAGCPSELPRRLLDVDSVSRKMMPMASGLLDYFPDALAHVSRVSYRGNEKHNPGQPLHWARGRSNDHADCIVRHLTERGGFDKEGIRHSAQLAWRALALLQEELESEFKLSLPRGAK